MWYYKVIRWVTNFIIVIRRVVVPDIQILAIFVSNIENFTRIFTVFVVDFQFDIKKVLTAIICIQIWGGLI